MNLRAIAGVAVLSLAVQMPMPARAQQGFAPYPTKPVRLLVGYTSGGSTDIAARLISGKMAEGFGQPVIVENRAGANGTLAAEQVMKSAPDGYTILISPNGPMTVIPAISSTVPYSPVRDFLAVAMIGTFPLIVTVNASQPIRSVKELVEFAKARPSEANYAGSGAMIQLASELFNIRTESRFVHIPYKGSGDSIAALLSNHVMMAMMDAAPASGPLKSGKLRGLAVTSASRLASWPELPTMAEAGIPDMVITPWLGFFVPNRTPAAVVKRIGDEVARVVKLADVRERLGGLGINPENSTPEEFARRVASDLERFTAIAKAANVKAD